MPALHGLRLERANASRQFQDGKFKNTSGVSLQMKGPSLGIMGEFFFGGHSRVPHVELPVVSPLETWQHRPSTDLRVTWLGHSTMLIESGGARVLTDPVFGNRASPLSFAGPKRFHAVPATIDQLPELDAVLLSHDHYDHLCESSIRQIAKLDVPVVTSLGVGVRLEKFGVLPQNIIELDWWEERTLPGGKVSFTATPAQHFSGRGLGDRNDTLWSSWVIQTNQSRVFFSGDTGLTEEFKDIGARWDGFDLVMLEIGAWHPAWGTIHLGPENALKAFDMLSGPPGPNRKRGTLLPVHWGTFDLGLHPWEEPAETLVSLAEQSGSRILTPMLGKPFEPDHLDGPTPWWRGLVPLASGRGLLPQPARADARK